MPKRFITLFFCMLLHLTPIFAEKTPENPENFAVSFYSPQEIAAHPTYRGLESMDPGFSKSIIELKNFPLEKRLMIFKRRLIQDNENAYKTIGAIKITKDGKWLSTSDGGEIYPFYSVSSRGFLPGERIYFRVQTDTGSFRKEISFIPNPLKAISQRNEFSLEAELVILSPTFYNIHVKGLEDNEEIQFISESLHEKVQKTITANQLQVYLSSFDVANESKGIGTLTLIRKNGDTLTARFPWGDYLMEYLKGNDPLK